MDSCPRLHTAIKTALVLILYAPVVVSPSALIAQTDTPPAIINQQIPIHIAEAARVFGIPTRWIHAVIQIESARNPHAKSHAGAMGLMQIMPATWAELRAKHDLGDNPFDPRENILAGTAYLRQMYDRFGSPGFLAAYNAGPARYQDYLDTGRALPRETRQYVARLAPVIASSDDASGAKERAIDVTNWQDGPLFVKPKRPALAPRLDVKTDPHSGIFVPRSEG